MNMRTINAIEICLKVAAIIIISVVLFFGIDIITGDTVDGYGHIEWKNYEAPQVYSTIGPNNTTQVNSTPASWSLAVSLPKENGRIIYITADYSLWERSKAGDRVRYKAVSGGITKWQLYRWVVSLDNKS